MHRLGLLLTAAAMIGGAAVAQRVGQPAPEIQFLSTFNFDGLKNEKLSQLQGSAVLIEFWGTH